MAVRLLMAALLAGSMSLFPHSSTMADEKKPLVVFVTGEHEYGSEETLPILARELERHYGLRAKLLRSFPDQNAERNIPGLEALEEADLAVFFLRWRQLPREQVAHIQRYLDRGKPVMGLRTSTHAFNYPAGHELEGWNQFGAFALGAPPGWGHGHTHYGHDSSTDVTVAPGAASHPILRGVAPQFHVRSWLYHVLPDYPPPDATRLLIGTAVNPDHDAVPNPVAWTWRTKAGGRVFMTTMGHPEDFRVEPFLRLLINGIHWALGRPVPERWAGKFEIRVPYRGIRKSPGG
jgi:type 1 glutamine amidotransferase